MTNPTKLVVPGADGTANPLGWALPASVAASYTGIFGGSLARTLQNGATINGTPSTVIGTTPTINSGSASLVGFPQSAIQTAQLETPNYTIMSVVQYVGPTGNGMVFGSVGGPTNNTNLYFAGGSNLTLLQRNSDASLSSSAIATTGTNWTLCVFTGATGVGLTGQDLTVGFSRTLVTTASAKTFVQLTTPAFPIGTSYNSSGSAEQAALNVAQLIYFPSVLSAPDQALMEAWMRTLAAKQGITV